MRLLLLILCFSVWGGPGSELRYVPVQSGGRVQPFDTFARESVEFISGRSSFQGKSSIHIAATWMLAPEHWNKTPFIVIQNSNVKRALELDLKQSHFSPEQLVRNKNFIRETDELQARKDKKQKLDSYFKEVDRLSSRLLLYQSIQQGLLPLWMPEALPAQKLPSQRRRDLINVFRQYSKSLSSVSDQGFKKAVEKFQAGGGKFMKKIQAEVHYNALDPFRWSWILYMLSLFLWLALALKPGIRMKAFYIFLIGGFMLHAYGMGLRSFIMSRPPVSNMFETVLWVPWAGLILSFILSRVRRISFPLIAGAVGGFLCLFTADQAGSILNDRLEPLTAVLRSNFWLSTHVLVITMSYSAFLLSFIIGDFLAFQFLFGKSLKAFKNHIWFLTKCLQAGVLLLALGTILGAVWADYSWGRFWGWDPKEVWALVSLLGYLALLHARLQGWVKEFGLAVGSIACFFLILMAWYGVNFVLGKGLHSYGFGQGGLPYVLAFIGVHLVLMAVVWRRKSFYKK